MSCSQEQWKPPSLIGQRKRRGACTECMITKKCFLVLSPPVQFMKASAKWPLPLLEPSFDAAALASHELLNI